MWITILKYISENDKQDENNISLVIFRVTIFLLYMIATKTSSAA